jgi:hypothetical protein
MPAPSNELRNETGRAYKHDLDYIDRSCLPRSVETDSALKMKPEMQLAITGVYRVRNNCTLARPGQSRSRCTIQALALGAISATFSVEVAVMATTLLDHIFQPA